MSQSKRDRRPFRPALLTAVAAIVLGILGMHALHVHGAVPASSATSSAHAGHAVPHLEDRGADHSTHGTVAVAGAPGSAGPVDDRPAVPGHGTGDLAMWCVVMLAAAAIGLLLAFVLRRVPPTGRLTARTRLRSILVGLTPSVAGTGPPPVWEFSVIRC